MRDYISNNGNELIFSDNSGRSISMSELIDKLDKISSDNVNFELSDDQFNKFLDKFSEVALEKLLSNQNLNTIYDNLNKCIVDSSELAINEFMMNKCSQNLTLDDVENKLIPKIMHIMNNNIKNNILAGFGVTKVISSSAIIIEINKNQIKELVKNVLSNL